MINRNRDLLVVFLIMVVVFLTACTQTRQPCIEPTYNYARVGVYSIARDSNGAVTTADSVLSNPICGIIDSSGNSVFLFQSAGSKLSFHLSSLADSCKWFIGSDTSSTPLDTLTFYYKRDLHFISNACGYTYYFTLDKISTTYNSIDSIALINGSVTNDVNVEHIKIYYPKRIVIPRILPTTVPPVVHGPNIPISL